MKNWSKGWRYVGLIAGLSVMAFLVMDFNSRMAELRRLTNEAERVSLRVTQLVQAQTYLEGQIEYAQSDAAVEQWAYEEARWVRPGDYPITLIPGEGEGPTEQDEAVVEVQEVSPWQVWLALFFDPYSP